MFNELNPRTVLFIVGPTGSGKTTASIALAKKMEVEIINADSRQVYRQMDIGTAKPTNAEKSIVTHHLFDLIDPDEIFSLANYLDKAIVKINSILESGVLPVVVGGSGQYVWALAEGWTVPRVEPNASFRKKLETESEQRGNLYLHGLLKDVDPTSALTINPNNIRRIIRALEVFEFTGKTFSSLSGKASTSFDPYILGLWPGKEALLNNLDLRIDKMVEDGWVAEVKELLNSGYKIDDAGFTSAGYKDLAKYIEGTLGFEQALIYAKASHRALAKKQMTWFKLDDPRIAWQNPTDSLHNFIIKKPTKSNSRL